MCFGSPAYQIPYYQPKAGRAQSLCYTLQTGLFEQLSHSTRNMRNAAAWRKWMFQGPGLVLLRRVIHRQKAHNALEQTQLRTSRRHRQLQGCTHRGCKGTIGPGLVSLPYFRILESVHNKRTERTN
eukprot:1161810-Pelagomonas_calceolata.AAC.13